MRSLSSVGLGLSLIFGCLLLALVAELYYLLWWKNRITHRGIEDDYRNPAREFLYMFCWKTPSSSLSSTALNPSLRMTHTHHFHNPQALFLPHPNKDLWPKTFETLSAPPRFLPTINEETKEDLESEDGKLFSGERSREGSRSRSFSDLLITTMETPFFTPLSSPPYFTPPLTPIDFSFNHHGFNPLFGSPPDEELNRMRWSPPPKFKFLQDAEEKLHRREQREEDDDQKEGEEIDGFVQEEGDKDPSPSVFLKDEENGSFITLIVSREKEKE